MVEDMLRQPDRPQAESSEPEPRDLWRRRLDHVPGRQRHDFQAKKKVSSHQLLFFSDAMAHTPPRLLLSGMTFDVSFLGDTILVLCAGTPS